MKKLVLFLLLAGFCTNLFADDDRTQLPTFFKNSYIGFNVGWEDLGYSNANLENNLKASSIDRNGPGFRVFLGHYFNPYLALQLGLMRPFYWTKFHDVYYPGSSNLVITNIFSLTLRPTLPINNRFLLYSEIGPAYIARNGFNSDAGQPGIKSATLFSALTGVGAVYRATENINIDANVSYVWPIKSANQPATIYAALGLYYLFTPGKAPVKTKESPYLFPANLIEFGFFDRRLFYWDATGVFANNNFPIFFNGGVHTQNGYYLMYERNFYHTKRWMSLVWGASVGRWVSAINKESFYTFSLFPAINIWPIRTTYVDLYLSYSLAGPTYISRSVIDGRNTGANFTFQDYIGLGVYLGKNKNFNINLKMLHYSNGNLFTQNPGIAPPLTINIGYAW